MISTRGVRAPGKAMLFGEYAVLDGAPAIVAAVDRDARAFLVDDAAETRDRIDPSPFVREAIAEALAWLASRGVAPPPTANVEAAVDMRVDTSALYADGAGGRKLGLGSSAAATVVAFGAVVDGGGAFLDGNGALTDGSRAFLGEPEAIFRRCEAAHARAQAGRGSGADVAASVWGGVLRFLRRDGEVQVQPLHLRDDIDISFVDTGEPASTSDRLLRLSDLRARDLARYRAVMAPLVELSGAFAGELERGCAIPLELVPDWNRALEALAEAIDLPILTPRHREVARAALSVGGAAKPSGAGGGDLAVCYTPRGRLAELRAALHKNGLTLLDLRAGAPGLSSLETPAARPASSARARSPSP